MGATKSKWRNNQLAFYDGSTYETVVPFAPIYFEDDFINLAIATTAVGKVGWTVQDLNAATEAIVANQSSGVVALALAANDQAEEAGLYWGDALNFDLDKGPIIEFKITASVLPTVLAECYFGFAGAYVIGTLAAADQGPLVHACFMMDGSGIVTIHTDDNGGADNNAVATGVTCLNTDVKIYRIDCTDVADVKFYINGVGVATGTTFSMANGANVMVQPYIMCYKSAGVGVGTLQVDYVKVWQATR